MRTKFLSFIVVLVMMVMALSSKLVLAQDGIIIYSSNGTDESIRLKIGSGETSGTFSLFLHNTTDAAIDNVKPVTFLVDEDGKVLNDVTLDFLMPGESNPAEQFSLPTGNKITILLRVQNLTQFGVFTGTIQLQQSTEGESDETQSQTVIASNTFILERPGTPEIEIQQANNTDKTISLSVSGSNFEFPLTLIETNNQTDIDDLQIALGPLTRQDGKTGPNGHISWSSKGPLEIARHGIRILTLTGELPERTAYDGWLSLTYGDELKVYKLTITRPISSQTQISILQADENQLISTQSATRDFSLSLTLFGDKLTTDVSDLQIDLGPLTRKDSKGNTEATINWGAEVESDEPFSLGQNGKRTIVLSGTLPRVATYQGWISLAYADQIDSYNLEITRRVAADLTSVNLSSDGKLILPFSGQTFTQKITLRNPAGNPAIDDLSFHIPTFSQKDNGNEGEAKLTCNLCDGKSHSLDANSSLLLTFTGTDLEATQYSGVLEIDYLDKRQTIAITVQPSTAPVLALQDISKLSWSGFTGDSISEIFNLRATSDNGAIYGLKVDIGQGYLAKQKENVESSSEKIVGVQFTNNMTVAAGSFLPVTATVNLNDVEPGKYVGKVWFTSDNAAALTTDLEITVKDGPLWPGIALLFGLCTVLVISWYVEYGKPRAEVIVRIERLEKKIGKNLQPSPAFEAFREKINDLIALAWEDLGRKKPQDAKNKLDESEKIYRRWVKHDQYFKPYYAQVVNKLEEVEKWSSSPFLTSMIEHLNHIKDKEIVSYQNSNEMKSDMDRALKALYDYQQAWEGLKKRQTAWNETYYDKAERDCLHDKLNKLRDTLSGLKEPKIKKKKYTEPITVPDELTKNPDSLKQLDNEMKAAKDKATKYYKIYTGARDAVNVILNKITNSTLKDLLPLNLELADRLTTDQDDFEIVKAAKLAENSWLATYHEVHLFDEARKVIQGLSDLEKKNHQATMNAVYEYVGQGDKYMLDISKPDAFRKGLEPHVDAAFKIVSNAKTNFSYPPTPLVPQSREPLPKKVSVADEEVPIEPVRPKSSGDSSGSFELLSWLFSWLPAQWQLYLFEGFILVIAGFILFITAWEEKYVNVATFGSLSDYRDLLLWGFGVGLTRAGVIGIARGWGVPLPG